MCFGLESFVAGHREKGERLRDRGSEVCLPAPAASAGAAGKVTLLVTELVRQLQRPVVNQIWPFFL